jgi:hypothetical protein
VKHGVICGGKFVFNVMCVDEPRFRPRLLEFFQAQN